MGESTTHKNYSKGNCEMACWIFILLCAFGFGCGNSHIHTNIYSFAHENGVNDSFCDVYAFPNHNTNVHLDADSNPDIYGEPYAHGQPDDKSYQLPVPNMDTYVDTDEHKFTNSDTHSNMDTDGNPDVHGEPNTVRNLHVISDGRRDSNLDADGQPYIYADLDPDGLSNPNCDSDVDTNGFPVPHLDANSHPYVHGEPNTLYNSHLDTDSNPDVHGESNSDVNTYANSDPYAKICTGSSEPVQRHL